METGRFDVAVAGGGIVGVAAARAIQAGGRRTVVVLEAEERLASHQSGRNSGVLHTGLYYRPGSAKARLCVAGRRRMEAFCEENGVPFRRCGKLVVALSPGERPPLDDLERRGRENGLPGLARVGPEGIREREPHAAGVEGLWVPETGVVDFAAVTAAMARQVSERGGRVATRARLLRVAAEPDGLVLETSAGEFRCGLLVNCCGLHSDRVARLCGADPGVRIVPFRGEYYRLREDRSHLVRGLVYPVPDPRFPFLGVHLTRRIDHVVDAGPNAVLALKRTGYRRTPFSLRDCLGMAAWPGLWRLALRHAGTGAYELYRSLFKRVFARDVARLVPEIRPEDLLPGAAGVRAQAVDRDGRLVDDFAIARGPRSIHVLNAPSPAATACLPIADEIAGMAERELAGAPAAS